MTSQPSDEFLDQQRHIGDSAADEVIADIMSRNEQAELYTILSLSETDVRKRKVHTSLTSFLLGSKPVPDWFDNNRLLRGQEVFDNYAFSIMTLLGLMSLPYCYAGSPGNKALFMSDKMRQSPGKRITDTAQFTIDVLTSGNLLPGKDGMFQIRKTRLIHALARHHIAKAAWNPAWGTPINQEDMAGTNLAFSYIILIGLQKFGVSLPMKEKEDFLFVWKYIGYQLGIDEQLLPNTFKEAAILTDTIKHRNFKKTDEGVILTRELVKYYQTVMPQRQAYFVEAQIKYFVGREVAGYLGIQDNRIKDKIVALTTSVKEVSNFFTIPKKSLNVLVQNYKSAVSKSVSNPSAIRPQRQA